MSQSHTSGPWFTEAAENTIYICRGTSQIVAQIELAYSYENALQNANLIAASPMLLQACELALEALTAGEPIPERPHVKAVSALITALSLAGKLRDQAPKLNKD